MAFFKAVSDLEPSEFRAFFLVLFYTGCRASEALNLRVENIDNSDLTITFATLKQRIKSGQTPSYRPIPVPTNLIFELKNIIKNSDLLAQDQVFRFSRSTGWRRLKKSMQAANIEGIQATTKGLRHGFAVACVSQGVPIETIRKLLGHKSLKNTMIYLDILGEEERKLIQKTWPTIV